MRYVSRQECREGSKGVAQLKGLHGASLELDHRSDLLLLLSSAKRPTIRSCNPEQRTTSHRTIWALLVAVTRSGQAKQQQQQQRGFQLQANHKS
jgi:hypothetical protein